MNTSALMSAAEFRWPVRIYYEDTDAAGIVYHANFLKYMERARTEWLRAIGYGQDRLAREYHVVFVIRRCNVEFLRPARFNDLLTVTARISRCGRASMEFVQGILDPSNEPLCRAGVKVGCVDNVTMKPRAMPEEMFVEISNAH